MTQSVGVPFTANLRVPIERKPQRIIDRERMRDAGLIVFRRDHPDLVGQGARDLLAYLEAFGIDAVVVGDENAHHARSMVLMPPI